MVEDPKLISAAIDIIYAEYPEVYTRDFNMVKFEVSQILKGPKAGLPAVSNEVLESVMRQHKFLRFNNTVWEILPNGKYTSTIIHNNLCATSSLPPIGIRLSDDRTYLNHYLYLDKHGKISYRKSKYLEDEKKHFEYMAFVEEECCWKAGIRCEKVPYNLPQILASTKKYICVAEGEKDADTLLGHGCITTSMKEFPNEYRSLFKNKVVVIFEDNDDAGRNNTNNFINMIKDVSVKNINVCSFGTDIQRYDVSDFINDNGADSIIKYLEGLGE